MIYLQKKFFANIQKFYLKTLFCQSGGRALASGRTRNLFVLQFLLIFAFPTVYKV